MTTIPKRKPTGLWENLPPELLSSIAEDLGITELISFRGVCKPWRASASQATARVESLPGQSPWFLVHSDIKSKCLMYSCDKEPSYEIEIPELKGATCLASSQGWLLLSNNKDESMFFLCPFSRARIDLPRLPLPLSQLSDRVAAFSSPPTSKDCVVCVPHRDEETEMGAFLLFRGHDQWTMPEWRSKVAGSIKSAAFSRDGKFYFLGKRQSTGEAPPTNLNPSKSYAFCCVKRNDHLEFSQSTGEVPPTNLNPSRSYTFCVKCIDHLEKPIKEWLGAENDIALSTCGTVLLGTKRVPETDVYTDICIVNKTATVDPNSASHVKGIWFHPRFFELPLQRQTRSSL